MATTITGTTGVSQCQPNSVGIGDIQATVLSGTTTQSGGIPTGAIIERGSNANGEWTKWADGTMICIGWVDLGLSGFVGAGNIFFAGAFSGKQFPVPFVASPKTQLTVFSGSGLAWCTQGSSVATTTATQSFYVMSPSAAATALTLTYIAIGRWY